MTEVPHAVVIELFEGDEMGPNSAGVLQRPGFLPPESLAGGERERQVELRLPDVERLPFQFCGGGGGREWLGILQNVAAFRGNGSDEFGEGLAVLRRWRG